MFRAMVSLRVLYYDKSFSNSSMCPCYINTKTTHKSESGRQTTRDRWWKYEVWALGVKESERSHADCYSPPPLRRLKGDVGVTRNHYKSIYFTRVSLLPIIIMSMMVRIVFSSWLLSIHIVGLDYRR
jgi:hypothetical protein